MHIAIIKGTILVIAIHICSLSQSQNRIQINYIQSVSTFQVEVTFISENKPLEYTDTLMGGIYLFNHQGRYVAKDMQLIRKQNIWSAEVNVIDTCVVIVANVKCSFEDTILASALCHLPSNTNAPHKMGYNVLAWIYSGSFKSNLGIPTDTQLREKNLSLFFESAKEHITDTPALLDYYVYQKDTSEVKQLINSVFESNDITEYEITYSITFAKGFLKNTSLGDSLINLRKERFPKGKWLRSNMASEIVKEQNPQRQITLLDYYLTTFPEESTMPSDFLKKIKISISKNYSLKGNLSKALEYLPVEANTSQIAAYFEEIAQNAYQKNSEIKQARMLSKIALTLLESERLTLSNKPSFLTDRDYLKSLNYLFGRIYNTYACLLFEEEKYEEAFYFAAMALQNANRENVEVIRNYHMIMEKCEPAQITISSLTQYISKGKYDSAMVRQYKYLNKDNPTNLIKLEALLNSHSIRYRDSIKLRMINEKAPHFTLSDLAGNRESLESLKGKIVILDFWATWCVPCIASFPSMQQAIEKYKTDTSVKFLFINTWESVENKTENVINFFKSRNYTFNNLIDANNLVSQAFQITSIPTKFIIDKLGRIRFKIIDFNNDTDATLRELETMISLLQE